eukprot:4347294-Prymnesium_polylepis.1
MSDAVDGRSEVPQHDCAGMCGKTTLFYRSHPPLAEARQRSGGGAQVDEDADEGDAEEKEDEPSADEE